MYLLEIKPEIPFQNYDLVKISLESDKYISTLSEIKVDLLNFRICMTSKVSQNDFGKSKMQISPLLFILTVHLGIHFS